MPVRLLNNGNNKIQIAQDFLDKSDGTITINGDGSHVLIGDGANAFERMSLTCGPSSTVHIGHGVRLASVQIYVCPHSKLLIGHHSAFANEGQVFVHETKPITIGHNCLISEGVNFWVSDAHSIIDLDSGRRINPSRPIHVGHRVWLGRNVSVFKGAHIGDGAIIGAQSIVSGVIPGNTLAYGSPARVVRENVSWDINLLPDDGSDPGLSREKPRPADGSSRAADGQLALAEANYRTEAVQTVLAAVLACQSWRGLNRKKFRRLIGEASSAIPDEGPASVQHAVLLAEARKVLWLG
ncbi:acyltransferase [Methylobacterium sp. E-066]|uniref:acyltransferase n=1 Tax=Methylobacterium sp. E-066 TaxID=2836584 RepID=UPI001FB9EDB7|nr:acyltransferase [Methylobacterium sp. E-066]MCJ2140517.1 acyltransferase [Methylobacterium sp. E-066]